MPAVSRAVSVCNTHPCVRIPRGALQKLYRALDKAPGPHAPAGDLSVALLTGEEIKNLHARFLNDPTPTDVITFDGDPLAGFAGEICVSVDQAAQECARYGSDFATELSLYLVHGYLHLAGLDDHAPQDIARMRAAETQALAWLRAQKALPAFRLAAR